MRSFLFVFMMLCQPLIAQDIDQDGQEFLASFTDAVKSHDSKSVLKHVDKKYLKGQIKFLNGNKEQFLNELLAGQNEVGKFMTPDFEAIIDILLVDMQEIEGEIPTYEVGFEVDIPDYILYSTLLLVKKKKKYVLIGAVG